MSALLINKAKEERHPICVQGPAEQWALRATNQGCQVSLFSPAEETRAWNPTFLSHPPAGDRCPVYHRSCLTKEEPDLATGLGPGTLRLWTAGLQLPVRKQILVASLGNLTEHSTWLSKKFFEPKPLSNVGGNKDGADSNKNWLKPKI